MRSVEQKWRTNMDKVSYARNFPGRLKDWQESVGKRIRQVIPVPGATRTMAILFEDLSFLLLHDSSELAGADMLRAIEALRPLLGDERGAAYTELDELIMSDRELTRRARLENILGAIRTNIGNIPELHEEIPRLLEALGAKGGDAIEDRIDGAARESIDRE